MNKKYKNTTINYSFKSTSHDEKIKSCSLERVQNKKTGLWNLQRKCDNTIIQNIWFNSLSILSEFCCVIGEEKDIYGWSGLVYIEKPIPTGGVYPFAVKAIGYKFTKDGELMEILKCDYCGVWE